MKRVLLYGVGALAVVIFAMFGRHRSQSMIYRIIRAQSWIATRIYARQRPARHERVAAITAFNHAMGFMRRRGLLVDLAAKVDGAEAVIARLQRGQGVLLVAVHTSLTLAAHGMFLKQGIRPVFVGRRRRDVGGLNWGAMEEIESIDADHPTVLRQIQSCVETGRLVVAFVDHTPTLIRDREGVRKSVQISPNSFAWAEQCGFPTFFIHSEIDEDGCIRFSVFPLPPGMAGAEQVCRHVCQRMGWGSGVSKPIALRRITG